MSKTLQTIQKLSKLGRILSKIVMICCIVAAALCLIGMILLAVGVDQILKLGDVTIHSLMDTQGEQALNDMYDALFGGAVLLAGEAVVAGFAAKYFRREYEAGTPFTFAGAKEMLRLGILSLAIPVVASIVSAIAGNIITHGQNTFSANPGISVTFGVLFIVVSLVFKYGAELTGDPSVR